MDAAHVRPTADKELGQAGSKKTARVRVQPILRVEGRPVVLPVGGDPRKPHAVTNTAPKRTKQRCQRHRHHTPPVKCVYLLFSIPSKENVLLQRNVCAKQEIIK